MTEPAIFNFSHSPPLPLHIFPPRSALVKTNKATSIPPPPLFPLLPLQIPSIPPPHHFQPLNILQHFPTMNMLRNIIPPSFPIFASISILFLLPILCEGDIYTPDTFPDSLREYGQCGLDHPGFACDPDGLLNPGPDGTKGVELLDRMLQNIRSGTECICDQHKSTGPTQNAVPDSQNPQQNSPTQNALPPVSLVEQCAKEPNRHGFTVSVAILTKMEVTDDHRRRYRENVHLPAIFAAELKNRQRRGQCNDEALIVLAVNDSSIRTSTGGMIATKLSSPMILNASHIAQKFFARRDFTNGLLHMLDRFAANLGAAPRPKPVPSWWDTYFWTFFPQAWRQTEWRWFFLIGLLLLIALLIVAIVFAIRRLNGNRNAAEYSPGVERGRTKA